MSFILQPTLFDYVLSDVTEKHLTINHETAEQIFNFSKNCSLFKWNDINNNCEARADALSILLTEWKIPHYKAWVFSGAFLKNHIGGLKQNWNYHVAVLLQVDENGVLEYLVVDPSTHNSLQNIVSWAENITAFAHSYHLIKLPEYYIFHNKTIEPHNWHKRNKQNKKWVIQGLAGINGLSAKGKCQLCFNKQRIRQTAIQFNRIAKLNPLAVFQNQIQ
jgi:hypothetical protein